MDNYYKATSPSLESIVASLSKIQYKLGEFVEAEKHMLDNGYGLTVLDTIENVDEYINEYLSQYIPHKIFLCECEDEIELPDRLDSLSSMSYNELCHGMLYLGESNASRYLKGWINNYIMQYRIVKGSMISIWPNGTHMFKRVKLVKEIHI